MVETCTKVRIEIGDIIIKESPADVSIETDVTDDEVKRTIIVTTKRRLTRITPLPPPSIKQ